MDSSSSTKAPSCSPTRSTTLFLRRDATGHIASVRNTADSEHTEVSNSANPELRAYLGLDDESSEALSASDADLVRVIDDLVDVMIQKQLIRFTDLPSAAQDKLLHRRRLRHALNGQSLLDNTDGPDII